MVEALILLISVWTTEYMKTYHGQAYHNYEQVIEKYHLDDTFTVVEAIQDKEIKFKVEF